MRVFKVCKSEDGTLVSAIVPLKCGGQKYEIGKTLRSSVAPFMAFESVDDATWFMEDLDQTEIHYILECEVEQTIENTLLLSALELSAEVIPAFWEAIRSEMPDIKHAFGTTIGLSRVRKDRFVCYTAPKGTVLCMDITPLRRVEVNE